MSDTMATEPILDGGEELERVTAATGLPRETVARILRTQLDLLFALGIAHGDEEDAARGAALRRRHPDLLHPSDVGKLGRSPQRVVSYELAATIARRESGASARDVVEVIAASDETRMGGDDAGYRTWARDWIR